MARNWTSVNHGRGNLLKTSAQIKIKDSATINPSTNIHYISVELDGSDILLTGDSSDSVEAGLIIVTAHNIGNSKKDVCFAGDFEESKISLLGGGRSALIFVCHSGVFIPLDSTKNHQV